jgi:HEAT repeat protein
LQEALPALKRGSGAIQRGKNQTVHCNLRIAAMLLTVAMIAPAAVLWAADGPNNAVSADTDDVQSLDAILTNSSSSPVQQEEAAKRLLQRNTPQARQALQESLRTGSALAQIAVAKAIAGDLNPDPVFIPFLKPLMGSSPAITKEAARALANYPDHPEIFDDLKAAASNFKLPEASRAQVVRAMGLLTDKRSAEFLVSLLDGQNEVLQNAAADALLDMTGLRENAQDHTRWQQWWTNNANKPADQWRSDLLGSRARELMQTRQKYIEMADELHDLLAEQYGLIGNPKAKKTDAILRYLQSPVPEARIDGIGLVYDDFTNGHPIPDEVRQQLRSMVGDSDRNVRWQIASKLKAINDVGAATALIAQLGQEPYASVRLLIAQALDESGDVRAAPALLKMLSDPSVDDAAAAAVALSHEIGEKLQQDPSRNDLVKQIVDALQKQLDTRTGTDHPEADDLRAGCVEALATLRDPRSTQTFEQLLSRPNESNNVRKAALRGMGNLADSRMVNLIANSLTDAKPEVRLQAALALKKLATFAQAEQLYKMMNMEDEPDARVRDAVWEDLKTVLHNATAAELNDWQNRFANDPDKKLEVLQALHNALDKTNDKKELAINDQNIGEILLTNLNRPGDAIEHFQSALDYWQNAGKAEPAGPSNLQALVGDMVDAQLKARKYPEAAKFAAQEMKNNPGYQRIFGSRIKNEADRLRTSGDKDGALQLIDAALNMPKESALDQRYQDNLREIQGQVNQPAPGGP